MDRNFLKELGLEKEVIDKILDQNGIEITALKSKLKTKDIEIDTLKTDLAKANTSITEFEKVDVEDLKTQLENEKAGRLKDKQTYQLNSLFSSAGCKDIDYLIYKLGDTIEFLEDGTIKDKDNLLEQCKKDYSLLFEDKSQLNIGSAGNFQRNRGINNVSKEKFEKMSYKERFNLKQNDPQTYQELIKE